MATNIPYLDATGRRMELLCSHCKGSGFITSPDWLGYNAKWQDEHVYEMPLSGRDEWERERPMPEGPEEIACGECEGIGWVLTEPGRALLDFIRRHS